MLTLQRHFLPHRCHRNPFPPDYRRLRPPQLLQLSQVSPPITCFSMGVLSLSLLSRPHLLPLPPPPWPPPLPLRRNSLEEPLDMSGHLLKNTTPLFAISCHSGMVLRTTATTSSLGSNWSPSRRWIFTDGASIASMAMLMPTKCLSSTSLQGQLSACLEASHLLQHGQQCHAMERDCSDWQPHSVAAHGSSSAPHEAVPDAAPRSGFSSSAAPHELRV